MKPIVKLFLLAGAAIAAIGAAITWGEEEPLKEVKEEKPEKVLKKEKVEDVKG